MLPGDVPQVGEQRTERAGVDGPRSNMPLRSTPCAPSRSAGRKDWPARGVARQRPQHRRDRIARRRHGPTAPPCPDPCRRRGSSRRAGSAPTRSRRHSLRGRSGSASDRRRDRRSAPRADCRRRRAAGETARWSRRARPRPGCRRARRGSASRHHCSRISPSAGSLTLSRMRGDLDGEGMEREEVRPRLGRREQVGQVAVADRRARTTVDACGCGRRSRAVIWPAARGSVHRDERRRDRPILGEKHVEGADRRAGRHRVGDDAALAERRREAPGERRDLPARCRRAEPRSASASSKTLPSVSRVDASAGASQP